MRTETTQLISQTFTSGNGYSEPEIRAVKKFLAEFCDGAVVYIVNLFNRARAARKPFSDVMLLCKHCWLTWWKYDDPERRGDPDNPVKGAGMKNVCAPPGTHKTLGVHITYV